MKNYDLDWEEIYVLVQRLYTRAIEDKGFLPEQAFSYVQEETDTLRLMGKPGLELVLQTAIFKIGMGFGLRLSPDSPDTEDAIESLSLIYSDFDISDLESFGLKGKALDGFLNDVKLVSDFFFCER